MLRRAQYLAVAAALFLSACAPRAVLDRPSTQDAVFTATVDLVDVSSDRIPVEVDPGRLDADEVLFRLPRVVQGTYAISDFGRFVDDFRAVDDDGMVMDVERVDTNTWRIPNARELDYVTYLVNDTFDLEQSDDSMPFSPSGTNIDDDIFVLNLHGFVGYVEGMTDRPYEIRITAPEGMTHSSALPLTASERDAAQGTRTDVYAAERYFDVTDNPMMYGDFTTSSFNLDGIEVVVSVYSPTGAHSAQEVDDALSRMMAAQRAYLGDLSTTKRYDIYIFLAGNGADAPTGSGALEHNTSTVVTLPEGLPVESLLDYLVDIVSHEFFHIVSPLTVHSEDVHYFDYNAPTFSKHLWLYEGQTEYFASHFQVVEGLEDREAFYEKMAGKIDASEAFDDAMSFTEMSEHVIDEPYASNYVNVYQKGALIGMCNDILVHELSGGERSLVTVMAELSEEYGSERPFEDDAFIETFTDATYPEVGRFLAEHVVGDTPIDYDDCLAPVGLEVDREEVPSTFFFLDPTTPYVDARPASGEVFIRDIALNSSMTALGLQGGDVIRSVNGTEYSLSNFRDLAQQSVTWGPDQELTFVVDRDGERVTLSGRMGTPTATRTVIEDVPDPSPVQLQLRDAWLGG